MSWHRQKITILRVLVDFSIFISVFILPWWFTLAVAAVAVFYFGFYLEFVFFALFIDLVYGQSAYLFGGLITILSTILFLLLQLARKKMIFYD